MLHKNPVFITPDGSGLRRDDSSFSTLPHLVEGITKPLVSITLGYRIAAALDIYGNVWAWTHDDKPRIVSKTGDYATCVATNVKWRGSATADQKLDGVRHLFKALDDAGVGDLQERADVLDTADIETAGFSAMTENIAPKDAEARYGGRFGNDHAADPKHPELGDGYRFRGHGYIHFTFKGNYADLGKATGFGSQLADNPDLLLDPTISAKVSVLAMQRGLLRTGHKLANYHNPDGTYDYYNSREIVNGNKNSVGDAFQAKGKHIEQVMRDCLSKR